MKLNIMGMFTAEGTAEQLAEYTARIILILKNWTDKQEQAQVEREIKEIWNNMRKGGESET